MDVRSWNMRVGPEKFRSFSNEYHLRASECYERAMLQLLFRMLLFRRLLQSIVIVHVMLKDGREREPADSPRSPAQGSSDVLALKS